MGAAMLLVEIGADMSVFGSAQRLASWVGICPGNNESAGKRKSGSIRKGNAWVRRLLCEFAQAAQQESLRAQRQVSSLVRSQGTQAQHRGAGAQDVANYLCDAEQAKTLRRQVGRLRGADGGALATDVGQAWLCACCALIC